MNSTDVLLQHILEPLTSFHDPAQLLKVARRLKQQGGEDWACGEALERAIEHLFGLFGEGQGDTSKKLGIDGAYGSTTFPLGPRP